MKVSEITAAFALQYCNVDEPTEKEAALMSSLILPAAIARAKTYTGLTAEALDELEEAPVAVLALSSFFWDNRSFAIEKANEAQNQTIDDLLAAHCVNLVPSAEVL